eukprot:5531999-Pleurochrysis_carterae.AAC.1
MHACVELRASVRRLETTRVRERRARACAWRGRASMVLALKMRTPMFEGKKVGEHVSESR